MCKCEDSASADPGGCSSHGLCITELCAIGELIESKMSHEVSLLGHRMEWLVVSEAFLFAAFTLVLTDGKHLGLQLRIFLFCFYAALGAFLAYSARKSIKAALAVTGPLLKARGEIEDRLKNCTDLKELPNLGPIREKEIESTVSDGNFSAQWVPLAIGVAWALLLIVVLPFSSENKAVPTQEKPNLTVQCSPAVYMNGTVQAFDTKSPDKPKPPPPRNSCAGQPQDKPPVDHAK